MKLLITFLSFIAVTCTAFATKTYHPHINRIDIAFQSGDRVIFTTQFNTVAVTGITIVSRKGVEYIVPSGAIKDIFAPRLDTLSITFHENSTQPYVEGRFCLTFTQGAKNGSEMIFFFEDGTYIGGLQEWFTYNRKKDEKK